MKIVLTVSNYKNLTGSELYVHDLAEELLARDHEVMILATDVGGTLQEHTHKYIKVHPFYDHPDFPADVVINSQPAPTGYGLTYFPNAKQLQVLHSHLPYEEPVIDKKIIKYVAVRPEVGEFWVNKYKAELENRISVVWNGVSEAKFNTKGTKSPTRPMKLFVGTLDHLRRDVIMDLVKDCVEKGEELTLVLNSNPFEGHPLPKGVIVLPHRWEIEELVKKCSETAGIYVGRTTIEGWMCGKPALIYDVDEKGHIKSKATYGVPVATSQFSIKYMTDRLLSFI